MDSLSFSSSLVSGIYPINKVRAMLSYLREVQTIFYLCGIYQFMSVKVSGANFKFRAPAGSQKWAPISSIPHLAIYGLKMGPF